MPSDSTDPGNRPRATGTDAGDSVSLQAVRRLVRSEGADHRKQSRPPVPRLRLPRLVRLAASPRSIDIRKPYSAPESRGFGPISLTHQLTTASMWCSACRFWSASPTGDSPNGCCASARTATSWLCRQMGRHGSSHPTPGPVDEFCPRVESVAPQFPPSLRRMALFPPGTLISSMSRAESRPLSRRPHMEFGSHSEICGKAINSVMMTTSQPGTRSSPGRSS